MMNINTIIAEGWVQTTLGDICVKASKVKRKEVDPEEEILYLDIGSVDNESNKIIGHKSYKWKDAPSRAQQIIHFEDILFSTVRVYLRNIAKVDNPLYEKQICSSGFTVIRGQKDVCDPKFLFSIALYEGFLQPLNKLQTGTSYPAVRDNDVFSQCVLLPPLPEQRAIVSKIEQLFSELDNGITNLKLAQEQLKVYRQAVLKKALEGELTKEWRAQQADLPSADELLAEIKKGREEAYNGELGEWIKRVKEWEDAGKRGKKPTKPKRAKEIEPLTEEELVNLTEMPDGWSWVKLGQIVWSVKDGPHYSPKYEDYGIPFISGGNIRPSGVDFSNCKYISKDLHEDLSKRCKPELNDLLYTKGGTTGIARVNTYDIDFNVWVHVAVLKPVKSIYPFYLQHVLNSLHCYRQSQKYTHGVGNQDLGLTRMILITLPVCSLEEQQAIVTEIETRLSVYDKLEQDIIENLEKAEALRQSILKKAFDGKLLNEKELEEVRNSPDWEPADALLERIKAEKGKGKQRKEN